MSTPQSQSSSGQHQLQKTFIAMIFAFVISYHAQTITEFIAVITNNWTTFPISSEITYDFIAVTTQIILALLMVSISWIMWSKSSAKAHTDDIETIFSVKFIAFIIEILLVTLYFGLIKSLEVDISEFNKNKDLSKYITNLSAKPEAFLMTLVFSIFLLWDLIIDILKTPPQTTTFIYKVKNFFRGCLVYCSISTICFIGSLLILVNTPVTASPFVAIFSDLALISVLLFFNQAKALEFYLLKLFPDQSYRPNTKRDNAPSTWEITRIVVLFVLYIIFFTMVAVCIHQ